MAAPDLLTIDRIDLSDRAFWSGPHEVREAAFATLRARRPIARFNEPDLRDRTPYFPAPGHFWAITRHTDIAEVSRHPEIYRSGQGATSIFDLPEEMVEYFSGMISTDNPRHARLRRIVGNAFAPRMVRELQDTVASVVTEIIDAVVDRGECDFAGDLAAWLPLRVICDMMGIPASEHAGVLRCANVILSEGDEDFVPLDQDPAVVILEAAQKLTELMYEIGEDRLSHPTDDLTTALVTANVDGESLTHAELAGLFILLVVAGSETTRTSLTHALWALHEYPEQREKWQSDPEGLFLTAADEVVRWSSPVIWMRRTVAEPTVLSGQPLEPGEKVLLYYASANRDEAVFDDPYTFDVTRSPNPHLGFGSAGPHFCLGAHLARREIGVMWRELFSRMPDLRPTAEPDYLHSSFVNGIKRLPCAWTPPG